MKSIPAGIVIGAIMILLSSAATVQRAQAASARAGAGAEAISPAAVDYASLVAFAAAKASGKEAASPAVQQEQPAVTLTPKEGVAWLCVDYN